MCVTMDKLIHQRNLLRTQQTTMMIIIPRIRNGVSLSIRLSYHPILVLDPSVMTDHKVSSPVHSSDEPVILRKVIILRFMPVQDGMPGQIDLIVVRIVPEMEEL